MNIVRKTFIRKFRIKNTGYLNTVLMLLSGIMINVRFASAAESVTTGNTKMDNALTALKTLFTGIVSMIGVVILVKNIMEFANAFQQRDQAAMTDGLRGIVAGLLMTFVGGILTLIGIK